MCDAEGVGDGRRLIVTLSKTDLGKRSYIWHSLIVGHPSMFDSSDRTLRRPGS